jgi:hypothetical protein
MATPLRCPKGRARDRDTGAKGSQPLWSRIDCSNLFPIIQWSGRIMKTLKVVLTRTFKTWLVGVRACFSGKKRRPSLSYISIWSCHVSYCKGRFAFPKKEDAPFLKIDGVDGDPEGEPRNGLGIAEPVGNTDELLAR